MQQVTAGSQAPTASVAVEAGPDNPAHTIAIPQSMQEIDGLRLRRSELASQLDRARTRRSGVVQELRASTAATRPGLEQRVAAIDERILQLESDIAATERAITQAPPAVLGAAAQARKAEQLARARADSPIDGDVIAILGFMGMLMLIPIVFAYSRRLWKRPPRTSALAIAAEGRLHRIEQAVESIAVEVERVSEGQRFVTSLLSEGNAPARSDANLLANTHARET